MTEKHPIDCLLITGMHRSGMSLLLECLDLLGVNIGRGQWNKDAGNSPNANAMNEITTTHDILLRDLGCRWDMVGSLPDGWVDTQAAESAKKRIRHIVETRFSKNGLWAVADPRLCRLMPLWHSVLKDLGVNPGLILTIRHPWEVAQSLKKNSQTELERGHLLWLALNKEAFDSCQAGPYTVTTYDQLVADPAAILNDIASQFDLAYVNPLDKQIYNILDVVRPEHKHHHLSGFNATNDQWNTFSPFSWLYEQISNHRSALKLLVNEAPPDVDVDTITSEALPTRFYPTPFPILESNGNVQKESSQQGNKLFYRFLHLIGQYERDQRSLELQKLHRILSRTSVAETLFARLHFSSDKEKSEVSTDNTDCLLVKHEWQKVRFPIPNPEQLKTSRLVFSPLNTRGVVSISAMSLVHAATESEYWTAATAKDFQAIDLKNAIRLSVKDALVAMTTSDHATLSLPVLADLPDCPLAFQAWIKVDTSQHVVAAAWQAIHNQKNQLQKRVETSLADQQAIQSQLSEKDNQLNAKKERIQQLNEELAQRQKRIDTLANQAEEANKAVGASQSRVADLESALDQTRSQKETLQKQLADKAAGLADKENQINNKQEQIQHLNAELAQRQNRIDTLANQAEEAKKAVGASQSRVADLESALDQTRSQKETLQKQLADKAAGLADKENQINNKQEQIQHLNAELAQRQNRIDTLANQAEEAKKAVGASQSRVADLESALDQTRSQKETLQKQLSENDAVRAEKDSQINAQQEEIQSLNGEVAQRQKQVEALTNQVYETNKALETRLARNAVLEKALINVNGKRVELYKKVSEKKTELIEKNKQLDEHRSIIDHLNANLASKEKWIEKIELELEQDLAQLDALRHASETAKQKSGVYKKTIQNLTQTTDDLRDEKNRLEEQLSKSNDEITQSQNRIAKLSEKLEQMQYDLNGKNTVNKNLKHTLDGQIEKNNSLDAELAKKVEANKALQDKVSDLEASIIEANNKLQDKESEVENAKRSQIKSDQAADLLKKKVGEMENALASAKDNINTRFKELVTITQLLKNHEDELNLRGAKVKSLEDRLTQLNNELSEKDKRITFQDDRVKQLSTALVEKDKKADTQIKKINHLSDELKEKKKETDNQKENIAKLTLDLEKISVALKTANDEKSVLNRRLLKQTKTILIKENTIERKEKELEIIKSSATWKVMAPLRGLSTPFKKSPLKKVAIEDQIELIRQSDFFDANWYLSQYPDVADKKLDPAEHYFEFGVLDGRDPSPKFNSIGYLKAYPDVVESGINPLIHYLRFGIKEGRNPNAGNPFADDIDLVRESEMFNEDWYLSQNQDVKENHLDPVEHYLSYGALEGRNPGPNFDTNWYKVTYPDVVESGLNPLVHYLTIGKIEGRKTRPETIGV